MYNPFPNNRQLTSRNFLGISSFYFSNQIFKQKEHWIGKLIPFKFLTGLYFIFERNLFSSKLRQLLHANWKVKMVLRMRNKNQLALSYFQKFKYFCCHILAICLVKDAKNIHFFFSMMSLKFFYGALLRLALN